MSPRVAPTLLAALLSAPLVRAQELAGEGVVRGDPVDAARARVEGGAAFATTVDLRPRARSAEGAGELLLEAPGLQLRRMGDGFAPQSVSLRGAPAAHVVLALDGVVLNTAASDDVDLALVPPSVLERADVYRGAVPLRFGASGLAGAVELVTRTLPSRPTTWVGAGVGSFLARRAGVFVAGRGRGLQGLFALGYRGSRGDFSYYDTRGTDDPRDDGEAARQNNASDAVDLLSRVCLGGGPARDRPCAQLLAGFRRRGLAGIAGYPTDGPFSEQRRATLRVTAPLRGRGWSAELYAAGGAREDRLDNRGPSRILTAAGGLDASVGWLAEGGATLHFARGPVRVEGIARVRAEGVRADAVGAADGWRLGALVGAELDARVGPVLLHGGVGAELMLDRGAREGSERAVLSPRAGARWRVGSSLELRANVAWLQRAPTLVELYGDRSVVAGNPALRNERALSGDLGAVVHAGGRAWSLRVEAAGFARAVEDLVVLRQTDRSLYRPVNRDAARVLGVEAQARLRVGRALRATVAYAFVDARITAGQSGTDGNRVPGVSPHDLYASVEARAGWLRAGMDLSVMDQTPLDDANGAVVPSRALVGASAGATLPFARGVSLDLRVTNLLDARVGTRPLANPLGPYASVPSPLQDWLGFPLPGRAVFVMVGVEDPSTTD